ncbi:MAG: hypothetical protein NTV73_01160 [Hyphomicrobiales bacterium]|nr:hypothetical protein [Hyphomicrobiales bacterium]
MAEPDSHPGFNFASAIDRHYVKPYAAMLMSFRDKNPQTSAAAYLLHYDLTEDDLSFLDRVAGKVGIPLTAIAIPAYPLMHFVVRKRVHLNPMQTMSPIAYGKSFLDRYLPRELKRIICIDADIIVASDMSELLHIIPEEPIAAVANLPRNHHHQFNSGFMAIDLDQWRRIGVSDIAERFLYEYSDALFTHDQHTLNLIFKDNWSRLDLKWNYMEDFYRYSDKSRSYTPHEIEQARKSPAIIHFAVGTDKPWLADSKHPMAHMYVKYANDAARLVGQCKLVEPGEGAG